MAPITIASHGSTTAHGARDNIGTLNIYIFVNSYTIRLIHSYQFSSYSSSPIRLWRLYPHYWHDENAILILKLNLDV